MTTTQHTTLPPHWKVVKLLDILSKLESGKRPKGGVRGINNGVPSIGGEHLNDMGGFKFQKVKFVPEEFADKMTKGIIEAGDILVVKDGATTAKTSFVGNDFPYERAVVNEHVFLCRLTKGVSPKWTFYFLWSQYGKNQILQDFRGAAQGGISQTFAEKVKLPFPPLPEQHRIVAKIEELFSELDNGVAQMKKVKEQLKTYRQAVLKWAFEGKLTEEWREKRISNKEYRISNDEVSLVAEESHVYRDKYHLPISWIWSTIRENVSRLEYGSSKKSEKTGKVPVLRMGNIQNGKFDWNDLVYSNDDDEIKKYLLKKDDILFNRTNSPELVGKTAIYKGEQNAIFAGYLIRIHYNNDINPNYLTYFLNSLFAKEYGNSVKTDGVNQSNINATKLSNYPFPLCNIEEQHQVVQEIESRFSVADKLEKAIEQSLQQAEALRQSILKQAFEGKLVAQETNEKQ